MTSKKKAKIISSIKKALFVLLFLEVVIALSMGKYSSPLNKSIPPKALSASNEKETDTASSASYFTASLFATPTSSPSATPTSTQAVANLSGNVAGGDFCLNVPVLMYHHVQPLDEANRLGHAQLTVDSGIFDQQMSYLVSRGYQTISSDQLVVALLGRQQLPANSIVITLDDGYDDAYNYAFGIAKKYNINLDLMIPSGLMDNPGYMSWGQLKEMAGNNLIHIYDHTWSHADLGHATQDKIEYEVQTSQSQLQSQLGKVSNVFVYPYGTFSHLAISIL
ncbi:MAG TPA: polysaccharide deacetylase family protein, partial [Methylomirabilota bacterium]|nr:polysaccharide deacetylase family protein [Methylomirabilota bacterium]